MKKYFSLRQRSARLCYAVISARRFGILGKILSKFHATRLALKYGIYLSPLAKIGPGLYLPHPVGIVIGEDVEIGSNVSVYQHVTLGRRNIDQADYPVVEDGVVIYAGAVITGRVRIGRNAIIAANAVVLTDVPEGATYAGIPAKMISAGRSE